MSDLALRPRSATELVDAAFQLYRRDPVPFLTSGALVFVPWRLIVAESGVGELMSNPENVLANSATALLLSVGGMVVFIISSSVFILLANDAYFGRQLDVRGAFRSMLPRLGSVFVASLLAGIFSGIGALFLFIPGVYIYGRLVAAKQAVLLEGKDGGAAVGRSWKLAKGHVLHALGAMILGLLVYLALSIGAQVVATLFHSVALAQLVGMVVMVLALPLVSIIETMLYYDIRIRREGFDIEYLAAMAPQIAHEQSATT